MKPAICFEMLYPGLPPEEKVRRIAARGFRAVEFWGQADKDLGALARALRETGARAVNFSATREGDLVDPGSRELLLGELSRAVEAARRLGVDRLMVLSDELAEDGRARRPRPGLGEEEAEKRLAEGLRGLLAALPPDLGLLLEPLNTALDHPGVHLRSTAGAARVLEAIGDPRLGILCDLYHMALMGEDPLETVRRHAPLIGHVHVADYPGRHEPGSGRGPWKEVLRELRDAGYEGYVGFEFSPSGESDEALGAVARLWREALGEGAPW